MKKVGRNDSCPCKSGKKYKKCCMSKFENSNWFSHFSKKELLSLIALLKSLPQNHGKNIRLEEIQKDILKSKNFENNPIDYKKLEEYLSENYSYNYLEDPPENLFTENIMTPIGNMVIFPGITDGQVSILQSLINVLLNRKDIPNIFAKEALDLTFFLLSVSNIICDSLNYERNLSYEDTDSNNIYFPNENFIKNNIEKLIFPRETLFKLCIKLHLDFNLIENFIINESVENFKTNDPNQNPIIYRPIIKIDDDYIIISPTNLVFAMVFNIYNVALKHNCLDILIKEFSIECWQLCDFLLSNFGYKKIDFRLKKTNLPFYEGVYIFDTDKLAYVNYQFDDGTDYNPDYPLKTYYRDRHIQSEIINQKNKTLKDLANDNNFKHYEIFNLNISLGIGRPVFMEFGSFELTHLEVRMDELITLHKSDKLNNLTLYNFAIARGEIRLMTPFFLDNISMFINNNESFYLDDNHRPNNLFVGVGNALDFKTKAIIKNDIHVGIYPFNNSFIFLPVERVIFPAILPIYKTTNLDEFSNKILSKAFQREVWIESLHNSNLDKEKQFTIEICITIAFWFNEIGQNLTSYLKLDKIKPLIFKIDFEYIENIQSEFDKIDTSKDTFQQIIYSIDNNEITLKLNTYFYKVIYRNDNLGEQLLMKRILFILSQMYDADKKQILNLDLTGIDLFIENNIPISQKKKLLFQISDIDVRNNPNNLISYNRKLSSYHVNKQLDNISKSLGYSEFKKEIILKGDEKEELLKKILHHFQNLIKENISKFKFEDILTKLLSFYELLIFKREHAKFQLIPQIECFKNHCNIEKEILKDTQKNTTISLSVRCLIEYVINNPPNGNEYFDSNKFDESIALMNNIINWGFLYDEHIFKITDVDIIILKSGRIGISKDFRDKNIEPFYNEKFKEDIFDYSDVFINEHFKLPKTNDKTDPVVEKDEYELAFEDEFEVDYHNYSNVIFESALMAFEKKNSILLNNKKEFISTLSKKLNIELFYIEKIISTFSITINESNQSNYFDSENNGNYPWRYNRKLSLLQKPFIIRKNGNEETIYFGSRELYDSFVSLHSMIFSGRFNSKKAKMNSFLSRINKEKGDDFNNELFDFIKSKLNYSIIDKEITIGPKKSDILYYDKDLGDFDILLVDKVLNKIVCIESKNTNFARTPYEMHREINNFITKSDKGWIQKVKKREDWLNGNKNSIKKLNNTIDYSDFSVEYVFITKEAIPLSFIKDINYRFLTMYDVRNNPLILLEKS